MAHRRGSFRGRGTGISESQRRKKTWSGFALGATNFNGFAITIPATGATPDATLSLVSFSAAGTIQQESTLMRLRGSVSVPKSTPDATTALTVAFGIAMVTDEAAAAASVPNPATAIGADWDGWLFYRANVAAPADANATVFDAKAMRKFDGGMSLVMVGGQAVDLGAPSAPTTDILIVARGLFLLA